jgi:hypothetical protein
MTTLHGCAGTEAKTLIIQVSRSWRAEINWRWPTDGVVAKDAMSCCSS